jgi:DNA-binding NtrC family response regulator
MMNNEPSESKRVEELTQRVGSQDTGAQTVSEQDNCQAATILVIDDNERIVTVCREVLEEAGYRVLIAREGGEGTQVFSEQHDDIDVVMMDWIMPGLDGLQWIECILDIDPEARIVFCTGHFIDEATRTRLAPKVWGFLKKPFDASQLLATMAEVLGGGDADEADEEDEESDLAKAARLWQVQPIDPDVLESIRRRQDQSSEDPTSP